VGKETGLGDNFYLDGYDLSGDVGAISNARGGNSPLDMTGINKSAHERQGGQLSGEIEWSSFFNPAAAAAHPVLSALPTTNRIASYFHAPAIGQIAASIQCKQLNYDPSRSDKGELTIKVHGESDSFPLEWGEQLTAGNINITAAGAQASLDYGSNANTPAGSTPYGLQAYLQAFSVTGTSATVAIQHSNDNGSTDPWANITGAVFSAVAAAPQSQRIATAGNATIKRWLRVNVTGTFSSFNFAVMVARNIVAVAF
jgi:hypothetical protein